MKKNTFNNYTYSSFYYSRLLIFCSILFFSFSCQKENKGDAKTVMTFDQFVSESPLELAISTDLSSLFSKEEGEGFQKAHCKLQNQGVVIHEGDVKVKSRGVTRKRICELPPIMLKIGKGKSKLKLKIVAPCQEGEAYQQLVYKEYLTYQLYNHLTDYSFRTQLVNVTYQDSEGKKPAIQMKGFLIENDKQIANRMVADIMKDHEKLKFIDQESYRLFTMFQYCIGNTDWNLSKRHNIKLVRKKDSQTPVPVPYDFDYAGLVDAPYAIPHPQLPIKHVKQRHFMWRGKHKKGFEKIIDLFEKKKLGMFSIIENSPHLIDDKKMEMVEYLKSFYHGLEKNEVGITS